MPVISTKRAFANRIRWFSLVITTASMLVSHSGLSIARDSGGAIMNTRLPATIYPRVLQQGAEEHFYRERMKKGAPYEREPQEPAALDSRAVVLHERAAPSMSQMKDQVVRKPPGPTVRR